MQVVKQKDIFEIEVVALQPTLCLQLALLILPLI